MMAFGQVLSRLWIVKIASHAGLGAMMAAVPAKPVKYIGIVTIDDADYKTFFAARSPLDADHLGLLLEGLAEVNPAVIVVDIDTSDPSFLKMKLPSTSVPIVWARPFSSDSTDPLPIAGGRYPEPRNWGYAGYQPGFDGYLADYPREVRDRFRYHATLHWQAVLSYLCSVEGHTTCKDRDTSTERELSPLEITRPSGLSPLFARDFLTEQKHVLDQKHVVTVKTGSLPVEALAGRIIFLGGSYSSCDFHPSYLGSGPMTSVESMALATEAELNSGRLTAFSEFWTKLLEVSLSLLLAATYFYLRPMAALLTSFFLVTLAMMLVSWTAFLTHISLDFVPFLIAIWLELMVRSGEEAEE